MTLRAQEIAHVCLQLFSDDRMKKDDATTSARACGEMHRAAPAEAASTLSLLNRYSADLRAEDLSFIMGE
jgi:hypothetical protein